MGTEEKIITSLGFNRGDILSGTILREEFPQSGI